MLRNYGESCDGGARDEARVPGGTARARANVRVAWPMSLRRSGGLRVFGGYAGLRAFEGLHGFAGLRACEGHVGCERAEVTWVAREGCLAVQHSVVIRVNRFPTYGTRARDKMLDVD